MSLCCDNTYLTDCLHLTEDLVNTLNKARTAYSQSQLLGAFTACSNITGICMDVTRITGLLKRYDALAVWDYASSAPYVEINMNDVYPIDALFFSGHKFIGGVSTPGVLIIKKSLIKSTKPKRIGGGTVFFVSSEGEWYLKDVEYREEGGTPDSVGIIRLALAIKLKRTIGEQTIAAEEMRKTERFLRSMRTFHNVIVLGAPIDSISGLFFHHNYISALLNDLFGIQSRAGCMCAGPYAQYLLGIDEEMAMQYFSALKECDGLDRSHLRRIGEYSSHEMLRPGFTRISVPYFWKDEQVDHLIQCIGFISERAADFIHLYQLNCESAEWHHCKQRVFHARKWLGHVSFTPNGMMLLEKKRDISQFVPNNLSLSEALRLADENSEALKKTVVPDGRSAIDRAKSHLRWFVLPIEVVERSKGVEVVYPTVPFQPLVYNFDDIGSKDSFETFCATNKMNGYNYDGFGAIDVKNDDDSEVNYMTMNSRWQCQPCGSSEVAECEEMRQLNDMHDDELESSKVHDDWDKRIIVRSQNLSPTKESKLPWHTPPPGMYKRVCEAIHGLEMIREGDKILVCLSGGKDSLSLLHILHFYLLRCRKNRRYEFWLAHWSFCNQLKGVFSTNFTLGAITVDPGSSAYNPRPLIEYCRSLNIDYFYEEQDIIGAAKKTKDVRSICAFCSRMKRGRLAAAAQHHGWNVLAMGQHLDDVAERSQTLDITSASDNIHYPLFCCSFFIAAFQNGNLSTMKAQYQTRDGTLRVIRPLIFVRERALREFAETRGLPVVPENCPACFNQATERHRIKQLLAQQELIFPNLFNSLRSALRPLLLVDSASTDQMRTLAIENIVKFNRSKGK
ncbi:aminotransferase, class V [Dictyocaulus viviparus]|uniref:Aminotransferase, class V n=1 Tax=Dictyocaulus viviparus TaxID=29172 RepID=A0A0D8XBH9_DICVI|nr:aminotransferase, class V [Dictyocaulus viviparus]